MKILFNDIMPYSNAPDELKSPMLSETAKLSDFIFYASYGYHIGGWRPWKYANSIGIGNTDGTYFEIYITDSYEGDTVLTGSFQFAGNGLYMLGQNNPNGWWEVSELYIKTNATYIGRVGLGIAVNIPTTVAKEPAFCSTAEPRTTLSGQVIPGAGGYNYRTLSLDSRYKIDELAMNEIKDGYKYIGMGYPFFIDLADEAYKLPFSKFYGTEANQRKMSFESGVRKFLYSRRFEFRECF